MSAGVLAVIGVGGMGQAIARRQGGGKHVLLADFNDATLQSAAAALRDEGYDVSTRLVDVSSRESVHALALAAADVGDVTELVHTAGLSPAQAPTAAIFAVDLLGVALVLDEFADVIAPGGAGVVISSMAGHLGVPLTAEQEGLLATTPADELLGLPFVAADNHDAGFAYSLAKRANHLRVRAASRAWGVRGARVNSISPGVISTAMGQQELAGESGARMRAMVQASGTGRFGTPNDIADAAAFLLGPTSSFVTGTDLLVDGGVVAIARLPRPAVIA